MYFSVLAYVDSKLLLARPLVEICACALAGPRGIKLAAGAASYGALCRRYNYTDLSLQWNHDP